MRRHLVAAAVLAVLIGVMGPILAAGAEGDAPVGAPAEAGGAAIGGAEVVGPEVVGAEVGGGGESPVEAAPGEAATAASGEEAATAEPVVAEEEAGGAAVEAGEPEPAALEEEAPLEEAPKVESPAARALPVIISKLEIVGYERISEATIRQVLTSQEGGIYSEKQVMQDRQTILGLGWFKRVEVSQERVESGVRLTFRTIENPVIAGVEFEGMQELSREELVGVMKTKPGEVYNSLRLSEDAKAIAQLYRSKGFIYAIVVGQQMSEEGMLTLVVAEGVIEQIKITGNTHTKTYVIRRYIRTREGEVYNNNKAAADVTRLTNLGYFETVSRRAEAGEEPLKVTLIYTVVEKRHTGLASVGGGYSSSQGMVGFVDLTKSNLKGTGQSVAVRGEFGGRTSYELAYRHPWVMTPETRMNLGVYDRLIVREAFVTTTEGEQETLLYDERRSGGNVRFGRPLSDHTTAYLGFRTDDVSLSDVSEEEQKYLTGPAFEPREVRSFTLAGVTDTRDNMHNPRRGAYQQLSMEVAGAFGGARFKKYTTDHRRYMTVRGKDVFAVRLLAGTISGDAPYLEQFLIGGSESLRGYRPDRFAGSNMAIMNAEYRFPVGKSLMGVLFTDVGDAWGGAIASDPFFQGDESFKAHVGYGAGVRVQTPIGPLRLDLGFSQDGTETHFGVSHMF